jgi:RNA polymerase sigma factor (sigma-70 family)
MGRVSIPLLSHYLRRLTSRSRDPSSDHELLQRFVVKREEAAFAALVERHAAMVLGLCRSILRNHHDAEDVFQAAFLVLARKAGSIRKGDSVGSWLYAVAYRLAHKARLRTSTRHLREQQAASPADQTPMDEVTWGELRDILHEEVSRLPEKYRAAVVLCYWEGQTHEQAGQQLGCAKSTIKDRLERAREMLRKRLARRGLALSATWFAAALSEGTSAASVELVQTTVRGAVLFSMGQLPPELGSAKAVAYAKGAVEAMLVSKLKYGLALVLMLGLLGSGAGMTALYKMAAPENEPEALATASAPGNEPETSTTAEPLPAGTVARLGTLHFRHSDPIHQIAIGTDGTSVFSAAGTSVYVWDLATGMERRRFRHGAWVDSFVCSGDGKLVASGCHDGTIHLWDNATGQELHQFKAHNPERTGQHGLPGAFVSGFTPDGRQLISTGPENGIRLWEATSGKLIHEFDRLPPTAVPELSLALSPDGKSLAGVVRQNEASWLLLWEVATGLELKRKLLAGKRILSPVFSPDGKMLAIAVGEVDWQKPCDIQLWDADASKEIRTLRGHKGWAWCQFAPDSKTLVSRGADNGARLWDVATGKEIGRIGDKLVYFNQLLFCPDGRTLVSFTQNNHALRFWDRVSGKEVRSSRNAITPIDFLSFSPDGHLLATGSTGHWVIRIWDVASRKTIRRLEHNLLSAVQFSPDSGRLASAATGGDSQVRIWEMAGGKEARRIPGKESGKRISRMAWSGDGKVMATWTWDQNGSPICLWDPDTGKQLRELNAGGRNIDSLVFSPDSKLLAALRMENLGITEPEHILLWEVDTGRLLPTLELPTNPPYLSSDARARLAFSPDGRTLVAGGQRAEASIYGWELASGRLRFTLKHNEDVACLAFSPDGKFLAAANNYSAYRNYIFGLEGLGLKAPLPHVHIWDMTSGKEIQVLKGHQGPISTLAFSPDGKLLATGSYDTTVLLWDATRFKSKRPSEVQLSPDKLEALWADLGGEDAAKAYDALRTMANAPKSSVAFLKRHLQPVAPVDAKQMARLLVDLDSEQFAVREKTMQQLAKLGDSVATELRRALAGNPPLEVKRRIEQLLDKQNDAESIRMVRALETLENIGTEEARDLCAILATGVPDAPLTREARATLRRLSR